MRYPWSMANPHLVPLPDTGFATSLAPIRVAIVEDERPVGHFFERALQTDAGLSLAFSAQSMAEAMFQAQRNAAQVYLVDLGLPDGDGRDFIRWVAAHQPSAHCMVVTVFGDDEHIVSSFAAGAVGYLLKDATSGEIALRIHELVSGGSPISPSVARRMLSHFRPVPAGASKSPKWPLDQVDAGETTHLSEREGEVLRLIEKGFSYDEIAQLLGITWHTVTGYLRRVYKKLAVNSRGEAVYEARARGLL